MTKNDIQALEPRDRTIAMQACLRFAELDSIYNLRPILQRIMHNLQNGVDAEIVNKWADARVLELSTRPERREEMMQWIQLWIQLYEGESKQC